MSQPVLILSPLEDLNAATLEACLDILGVEVVRTPSLDHPRLRPLGFGWEAGEGWQAEAGTRPGGFASVWCRRPRRPVPPAGLEACDRDFVADEWAFFQENLLEAGPDLFGGLWVNPPARAREAEQKLRQLRVAVASGLDIPPTLATADPGRVRSFVAGQDRVLFKPFAPHTWRDREGRLHNAVASLLDAEAVLEDPATSASIALCPGIYQRYIPKAADWRVTVIGDRCFAARIRKRSGGAFVDWRPRTYMPDLLAEAADLPAEAEAGVRALMTRLGLVFGCVDLVETPDGRLVFLEVNPGGQFMFVEELVPELPLVQAMAAMLAEGRPGYGLAGLPALPLQGCRDLPAYRAWREAQAVAAGPGSWVVSQE